MPLPIHNSSLQTLQQVIRNIETLNKGVNEAVIAASMLTDSALVKVNEAVIAASMLTDSALVGIPEAVQAVQGVTAFKYQVLTTSLQYLSSVLDREPDTHEVIKYPGKELLLPATRERITLYSPSILLLEQLRSSQMSLHDLQWRQLEELVAEMLTQEGYHVQLGQGTKDGGIDIIAVKEDPIIGFFLTVWQAKKLNETNKVGVHVIRELAGIRQKNNATKGIIVTTTSLTKGALDWIEQDRYTLGKVDGNDLSSWIRKEK